MRLKLYRAANMAEVLAEVRLDLGPDALILSTRRVADGVEMTVAVDPEDDVTEEPAPPFDPFSYHGIPADLADLLRQGPLEETLPAALSFGTLPTALGEAPLLLAGPPGAGKTLTVARLATRLVLAGGSPLVITADGRRAGATEQLAAFTRLLGLNLVVATHPVTLGRALTRRASGETVLIDTPGCDPFDRTQRERTGIPDDDRRRGDGPGAARRDRSRRDRPTSPGATPRSAPPCWSPPASIWRAGSAACWRPRAPADCC